MLKINKIVLLPILVGLSKLLCGSAVPVGLSQGSAAITRSESESGTEVLDVATIAAREKATEDMDLIAVVSLSRDLCRHNHVGFCGDTPLNQAIPLEETPEWRVLRNSVFPSFDLKKFESQVHAECRQLKNELHGRMTRYAVA